MVGAFSLFCSLSSGKIVDVSVNADGMLLCTTVTADDKTVTQSV